MKLSDNIFRAYDIRGLYPDELDEETVRQIGMAFATFIKRQYQLEHPRLLIGKDNRTHGGSLQQALIEGLTSQGAQVDRLEDSCSPMVYLGICESGYDGGINVTASHNPANYNGCKLLGKMAHSISGEDIQTIRQMIHDQDYSPTAEGQVHDADIAPSYWDKITSIVELQRPLKVVIDAGNGIAGKYYPELFRRLGCEVVELYCEQDGTFPHHEPDPVVEANTRDLKTKVKEQQADLGISFDGDGDRCAIVDEQGGYHDANESFVLLIHDLLSRNSGAAVVYTVSNSSIVPQAIKAAGGEGHMVPVGHSFVEEAMNRYKACLGGEQSGHFFVAENYYGFDDAAYTAAVLTRIFSASDQPVSQLYSSIPQVFSLPEMRPDCPDDRKFEVIQSIRDKLQQQYDHVTTLDGVRVDFPDGSWFGMRASNTSPVLSVLVEAQDQQRLEELHQDLIELLKDYDIAL